MNTSSAHSNTVDTSLRQQLAQGFELLRQGKLNDARQASDQLLATYTDNAEVRYFASEVHSAVGDAETALAHINAAIVLAPGQLPLLSKKARLLVALRRRTEALNLASEIATSGSAHAQVLWAAASILSLCGDVNGARDLYQRALAAGGDHPALRFELATMQFFTGAFDEAERNLSALLIAAPKHGHALYLRAILRQQTVTSNHIEDLQERLRVGFPDAANYAACLYALAKEYEDLEQAAASFSALVEGAKRMRGTLRYDAEAERRSIEAIRETYTSEVMQAQTLGHEAEGAIFIVGMPRTGTTLVERMLGRHSEVSSAGELRDFGQALANAVGKNIAQHPGKSLIQASLDIDYAALGRDYMQGARQAGADSRYFIDKMPINYIYCGLIQKALPRAKIIHLRRDPMDTCYAVFKTLFNQAYPFSYDLDELADYYITYHRQMRHWESVMPGGILEVRYEDLVSDPQSQTKRLSEFCGLDMQQAMLAPADNEQPSTTASAAQVREPIHDRSIGKWRRYETGLAHLRNKLEAAGIVI